MLPSNLLSSKPPGLHFCRWRAADRALKDAAPPPVLLMPTDTVGCRFCFLRRSHSSTTTVTFAAINMSSTLNLNCWIIGDDPGRVFPVEIAKNKTVGGLKKAIKNENQNDFSGIDAKNLHLWKVSD